MGEDEMGVDELGSRRSGNKPGLHCLRFQSALLDKIFYGLASLFEF